MDKLIGIFITSFIIAFSGALMPGPLLGATINESGRRGWKVGPLFILGHGILEGILIIGLFLGLAPLLTSNAAFIVIAFGGGSFMIWMAFGMFRSLPHISLNNSTEESGNNLILTGILMSLANPYWTIWWATIGLGYILTSRKFGFLGVLIFFLGHILADLLWYTFVSLTVYKGREILPVRIYKSIIAVCALFLIGYAIYLISGGIILLV